jgi:hypothetical protein
MEAALAGWLAPGSPFVSFWLKRIGFNLPNTASLPLASFARETIMSAHVTDEGHVLFSIFHHVETHGMTYCSQVNDNKILGQTVVALFYHCNRTAKEW